MISRLLFFYGAAFFLMTLSVSCNKDNLFNNNNPVLTFRPDTSTFEGAPGDTWKFKVEATDPDGFDSLYIEKVSGLYDSSGYATVSEIVNKKAGYNFSYTFVQSKTEIPVTFLFGIYNGGIMKNQVTCQEFISMIRLRYSSKA